MPGGKVWIVLAAVALLAGALWVRWSSQGPSVASGNPVVADAPALASDRDTPAVAPAPAAPAAATDMGTDAWFLAQSEEVQASMVMGMGPDYHGHGSVAGYFLDLERRIAMGDETAVLPAAQLYRQCAMLVAQRVPPEDPEHPGYLSSKACATLPRRESGYDRTLVAEAAQRGVEAAVLKELYFAPLPVAYSRNPEVRREWAAGVTDRLRALAGRGNPDAHLELGTAHVTEQFSLHDPTQAAIHYRAFLDHAPANHEQRNAATQSLTRLCMSGSLGKAAAGAC